MSDDDHGALGPEMPSGSDGPAIVLEDPQVGLIQFPLPPDEWHARFLENPPSWLADWEPMDEALSGSDDSMFSLTPSPRRGPATAHGGHMDTLTVYHAYRWSGVDVSDIHATTNESPPFGPGNPGRRVLIDDVLQIWYNPHPRELRTGTPWHPRASLDRQLQDDGSSTATTRQLLDELLRNLVVDDFDGHGGSGSDSSLLPTSLP